MRIRLGQHWLGQGPLRRGRVRGQAVVAALALCVVGLVPVAAQAETDWDPAEPTPLSVPGMPVSKAQSGELVLWGDDTDGLSTVPASLDGLAVSQVLLPKGARLVLTADGGVVGWGDNPDHLEKVPSELGFGKVVQIATGGPYAGAVTSAGNAVFWGQSFPSSSTTTAVDKPPHVSDAGVKQLAFTEGAAALLRSNGTVVAWGRSDFGEPYVPAGLHASAIVAGSDRFYALSDQGTVVSWGAPVSGGLPAAVQQPGNVKAVAAGSTGAVALLADNTVVMIAAGSVPAAVAAADPVLLANSGGEDFAVVDRDRSIQHWADPGPGGAGEAPAELNGLALSQIVLGDPEESAGSLFTGGAVVTRFMTADLPQVSGDPAVGATLTAVPGTFSGLKSPDSVTGQWLLDGVALPGATGPTLSVTADMVDREVRYQSTATLAGEPTLTSTSRPYTIPAAAPGMAVPLAQAGELAVWGDASADQGAVPAAYDGMAFAQAVFLLKGVLAVTAAGHVVGWGHSSDRLENVPANVAAATVKQIAVGSYGSHWAGAVTTDGRVLMWGPKRKSASPLDVPAGLSGVKQLVIGIVSAAALKEDGTIVTWGQVLPAAGNDPKWGIDRIPAGLHATAIALDSSNRMLALKDDGSLVSWGGPTDDRDNFYPAGTPTPVVVAGVPLPTALKQPGSVKAIANIASSGFLALRSDNILMTLGESSRTRPPVEVALGGDTVLMASGGPQGFYEGAVVDSDRTIRYWYQASDSSKALPPGAQALSGRDIVSITIAGAFSENLGDPQVPNGGVIITKMLRAELPRVSGSAVAGGVLTATPGTFSAAPDAVSGQWLSNGSPIPGATGPTLRLTSALAGTTISYRSTATKPGQTTVSSTSTPVSFTRPAVVSASVARGTYGKGSSVSVSVPGATGKVTLTVDGKSLGTRALVGGKAVFAVAKTTAPGNHAVKASYLGSALVRPGTATATLSVVKAKTGTPVVKIVNASSKKAGKVTVTIATPAGLTKATGKAQLVLKKGKSTKTVKLTVKNGGATAKLPKLPKGTWTASLTYPGNTYYLPAKSKTIKVKSK